MSHTKIFLQRTVLALAALSIALPAIGQVNKPTQPKPPVPVTQMPSKATEGPKPVKVAWGVSFPAAQVTAKRQNKYILAYFSGSDWDEWGKKLDKEVLTMPMFADWAAKNVILFRADFLATPKPQDLYKKQNENLKTQYQIAVVPTLLLLDGDGQVVARAVYENVKLHEEEPKGQPKQAIDFLDNMIKNRGEYEKLIQYPDLQAVLTNAKDHHLPVLLLVTKDAPPPTDPTKVVKPDAMVVEADKLADNQRFIRWVNVNTSFYKMKWPDDKDKSVDANVFRSLATKFKFGNTPAQLLLFAPEEEQLRYRLVTWSVLNGMEPIMMNLQKNLPEIPYLGTTWLTDLRTAKAIVGQQPKRELFLYFGDGTEFCQKFEKEILNTEEFTGWPFHYMVLVKFDFTKGVARPKWLDEQNTEQANLYAVRGYPFVILVNNKGQKVGEAKYQKGGPKPFIEELKRIYQSDVDRRLLTPIDPETPAPPKD